MELTKYLLTKSEKGTYFLSEKLNQDPLENYFGQKRARGGRNENPTVQQSSYNVAVQKSMVLNPVLGNCGRKRRLSNRHNRWHTFAKKEKKISELFIDMCVCECLISVSYRENAHNNDYLLPLGAFVWSS